MTSLEVLVNQGTHLNVYSCSKRATILTENDSLYIIAVFTPSSDLYVAYNQKTGCIEQVEYVQHKNKVSTTTSVFTTAFGLLGLVQTFSYRNKDKKNPMKSYVSLHGHEELFLYGVNAFGRAMEHFNELENSYSRFVN